ncbi:uncharacterized protein LAJ45_03059 [Morchella importuna]|uniref:uncharacterized protein n=1 Tax=Morchella importuna TaxID=1174673 RepID=UPI001E8CE02F|nr:uncharacterized protein LAJ45_03059 [Morchella importuna]KAH8152833.1 hypothetical protein LAJ45_03059 [Morchella importuna]
MPSVPSTPVTTNLPATLTPPPSRSTRINPPATSLNLPTGRRRNDSFLYNHIPLPASPHGADNPSPSPADVLSQMRFSYTSSHLTSPFLTPGNGRTRSRSSSNSRQSGRSPDRFIPSRANIQSFRMNCPAHLLSSEERLLRRSVGTAVRGRSASPDTRNISAAGAVGIFGIGIGAAPRGQEPIPRGREVHINVFGDKATPEAEMEKHERRLSAALGVDRSARVLSFTRENEPRKDGMVRKGGVLGSPRSENLSDLLWDDVLDAGSRDSTPQSSPCRKAQKRTVPTTPFRVLDAPGLHSDVYSWTEAGGARPFEPWSTSHVTSLAFSSSQGGNNILAIGRIDGSLSLWNPIELTPRIERPHNAGVACLAWKPVLSHRPLAFFQPYGTGDRSRPSSAIIETEELLVGDEFGNVTLSANLRVSLEWRWRRDSSGGENMIEGGEKYKWLHGAAVKAIAFCPWQKSLIATGGGSNDRCIHFFHTFSGAALATINVSAQVTSLLWSVNHREIAATFGYANPDHPIRIAVFSWPECKQVVQIPWQEDMRALYAVAYPGGPNDSPSSFASDTATTNASNMGRTESGNDDADILREEFGVIGRNIGFPRWPGRNRPKSEGCIVVAASDETVRFHETFMPVHSMSFHYWDIIVRTQLSKSLAFLANQVKVNKCQDQAFSIIYFPVNHFR